MMRTGGRRVRRTAKGGLSMRKPLATTDPMQDRR